MNKADRKILAGIYNGLKSGEVRKEELFADEAADAAQKPSTGKSVPKADPVAPPKTSTHGNSTPVNLLVLSN